MRTQAIREEIRQSLCAKSMKKSSLTASASKQAATADSSAAALRSKKAQSAAKQTRVRDQAAGGHQAWAKPRTPGNATLWEAAISRQDAQYRLLEKHGREVDLFHEVCFSHLHRRPRAAHFDDQVSAEVRKSTGHVPTCLQTMPMCTYRNRQRAKPAKTFGAPGQAGTAASSARDELLTMEAIKGALDKQGEAAPRQRRAPRHACTVELPARPQTVEKAQLKLKRASSKPKKQRTRRSLDGSPLRTHTAAEPEAELSRGAT